MCGNQTEPELIAIFITILKHVENSVRFSGCSVFTACILCKFVEYCTVGCPSQVQVFPSKGVNGFERSLQVSIERFDFDMQIPCSCVDVTGSVSLHMVCACHSAAIFCGVMKSDTSQKSTRERY